MDGWVWYVMDYGMVHVRDYGWEMFNPAKRDPPNEVRQTRSAKRGPPNEIPPNEIAPYGLLLRV